MGRHDHDAGPVTEDWEEPPPVAPLWRVRIVTSAVLLLAVVAGTWWAVSWLTSPAGPGGGEAPAAVSLAGPGAPGEEMTGSAGQDGAPEPAAGGAAQQTQPGDAVSASEEATQMPGTVVVHVAGEVREPGLVELPAGARVADALQAAGGSTSRAELDLLNLAAPVVDASQILVPGPGTAAAAAATAAPGAAAGTGGTSGTTPDAAGSTGTTDGTVNLDTVNLNTADAAALEQLPGIGPALAGRIVEHREQVGPYGSMADLDAVSGIGPAMMERLDGLVSW